MSSSAARPDYLSEQLHLMETDMVILVNEKDKPIGKASKKDSHRMRAINRGMLHRAFSVFIFNQENKLLLHQRAAVKVTFPSYWTNTCCSHPLYCPEEVEEKDHRGCKRAAIRKLEQELGIPQNMLSHKDFTFLTKIHYKAGSDGEWGEHEVDHILFVKKALPIVPNPSEIDAVRWVDAAELREMFNEADSNPQLKITPWFRMIAESFLFEWWSKLDEVLKKGDPARADKIYKLEMPKLKSNL
eukprot:gb/GEZN01011924.1/.p1 GENE.gb/GEZN01011924.1/~~gb/GEZN01011924.1/.p1  ORF type:complete len:243 (-),score=38.28 gb/GEZN01011924.1/:371-1099(-)